MAQKPSLKTLALALKQLLEFNEIDILTTDIIEEEFQRNKDRVIDISRQKISQDINNVKSLIKKAAEGEDKIDVISSLDEIRHKLPSMSDTISEQADLVWDIITNSTKVEISDSIKVACSDRAYAKKAPFHKNKNSMADALLLETFFSKVDDTNKFYFITHNTKDFSSERDNRNAHEDFEEYFSKENVNYSINLHNIINDISPNTLTELDDEHNWYEEGRGFYEILEAENKLTDIVWYNRHRNLAYKIEQGTHEVVDEKDYDMYNPNQTVKHIWESALKSAKAKEELYGDELYPNDDFEWGMINGKLSALRWVIGEDWDELYT
jgi:hypothetical protein